MTQTRRTFLASSAVGAAGLAISPYAAYASLGRASAPLRILVLGGTGFIGPHIVEACLARGHSLTLFNRGRTEKVTGHDFAGSDGIDRRYGNRDPEKLAQEDQEAGPDNPMGLSSLEEGEWDAVIDNSGYWPRIVGASAELLAPRVKQYLFISTVSVYDSYAEVGADASASVGTMEDPTVEDFGASFENYGPAKALCEHAVERAMPGRALSLRPGLIVGPGDLTGRFTYWPMRVARGGEMIAPGTPRPGHVGGALCREERHRDLRRGRAAGPRADHRRHSRCEQACLGGRHHAYVVRRGVSGEPRRQPVRRHAVVDAARGRACWVPPTRRLHVDRCGPDFPAG